MSNVVSFDLLLKDHFSTTLSKLQGKGNAAFDKLSSSVGKFESKLSGAASKLNKLAAPRQLSSNIDQLNHKLDQLNKQRRLSVDKSQIRALGREIDATEKKISKLEGMGRKGGGGGMLGGMIGGYLAPAAIGAAAVGLGSEVIRVRGEREKQEAVLTNAYMGDRGRAKDDMIGIEKYASKTPFQVTEITDSFVKLNNQGFKPTMDKIGSLGDLAAFTGKSFDQLTEAVLDARTGENERLKEFGIKAKVSGDKISFTFRGVTTTMKNTVPEIDKYLLSLGKQKGVMGSTAAISETLQGKISNLGDSWDGLMNTLGQSDGVLKNTISVFGGFLDSLTEMIKDKGSRVRDVKAGVYDKSKADITAYYGSLMKSGEYTKKEAQQEVERYIDSKIKSENNLGIKRIVNAKMNDLKGVSFGDIKRDGLYAKIRKKTEVDDAIEQHEGKLQAFYKLKKTYKEELDPASVRSPKPTKGVGANTDKVISDARTAKNIHISIGKMVEHLTVTASTITESGEDIKKKVEEIFLTIINDANCV